MDGLRQKTGFDINVIEPLTFTGTAIPFLLKFVRAY
jgi:hypothetical protein